MARAPRTSRHPIPNVLTLLVALISTALVSTANLLGASDDRNVAQEILDAAGIQGGLIVHLGCGDGSLTAALRAGENFLVHGLDSDADKVHEARQIIIGKGVYGDVSVDRLGGTRLPYVDNLVNLVIAETPGAVPMDEIMRVLCPNGVAFVRDGDAWKKTVKPRPAELDEWTHYLYDASGNAVSSDLAVGPPRHFQWTGSPRWSRHHDRRASVSAMVSAGSRIFYIIDEGSTASILLPSKTVLVARDAFNGTILWKRPISTWFTHLWPFKSGPTQLQRRLVAVGHTVFVTLGRDAPLTALDAATGETIRTYEGSLATEEVIASEGVLFLLVNDSPQLYDDFEPEDVNIGKERDRVMDGWPWNEKPRHILAVQEDSGEILWDKKAAVVPLTLAADLRRVYFHDGEKVVALDRKTGEPAWNSAPIERRKTIPTNITPTLVVYQEVVLFYGATRQLTGLSAETGDVLWTAPQPKSGHFCPEDVLVAGGLVWGGEIAGGRDSGTFTGRDPQTGEIKSQFPRDTDIDFMHQRCYRSKATDRYLLPSWTGIEFVDFRSQHWITHHWVRSGCIYGIMPCNGLVYTTPHDCACYMQAKLYGFCALAAKRSTKDGRSTKDEVRRTKEEEVKEEEATESEGERLEIGPAFSESEARAADAGSRPSPPGLRPSSPGLRPSSFVLRPSPARRPESDWPTYRNDAARSGFTPMPVSSVLTQTWTSVVGGRLSPPVVAGGRVLFASIDSHSVHALDAESGRPLWDFTAGGRVDSPPTVDGQRVLFGSADGYVYCLRASDGVLAWRFRAAPQDRRMTSFEQLESVWPVHGSVLVRDEVVYCVAGRSMFLDGGLRYLRIDARTGRKLSETVLDEHDPASGENLQAHVKVRNMPVGLPDVLSSDGQSVYMRSQRFDLAGNRSQLAPHSGNDAEQGAVQKGEGVHLFSPTGFLDDTWWHRSYWVYGRSFAEGAGGWPQAAKYAPAGRILAFDESSVYGFGRQPTYYRWRTPLEYHLFATSKSPEIVRPEQGDGGRGPRLPHPRFQWSRRVPLLVRALVVADKTIFIAGPPDMVDEEEAFRRTRDRAMQAKLAEQDAAQSGEKGGLLWAVSTVDGETLNEYNLDNVPVFDGLIAASGCLYMVSTDGKITCFSEPR